MGRKTDQRRQLRRRDFIGRRALGQLWAPALPACLAGRVVDCEALDIRASLPRRRRTVATDQPFRCRWPAGSGGRMVRRQLRQAYACAIFGSLFRCRPAGARCGACGCQKSTGR